MSNGTRKISSTQASSDIQYGYIVLPKNVDRTTFIEQCFRWERVSILVEHGAGLIHECYITREAISSIEFPTEYNQLGSCVVFITDPFSGHPVIFGVLSKEDESQLLHEGYFNIGKKNLDDFVTISGDVKTGVITISVKGGAVSQINLIAVDEHNNAALNLRCSGNINIAMEGLFKVNKGTEPMVKGTELKSRLDDTNQYLSDLYNALYTALQALDAAVPGTSAAFAAAMSGKNPGDYSAINSEESFLD